MGIFKGRMTMKVKHVLPSSLRAQKGVALLIVMLIMALMTTVAATMSSRMFVNYNRAETQIRNQQAYWYGLSLEELAKYAIKNSFKEDEAVTLAQPWAVKDQVYPIDEWQAKGSLFDKQACFNLNAFVGLQALENGTNPDMVVALQNLIESQGFDSLAAETAATATWEFIDSNNNVQSTLGVEDSEYQGRKTPFVTSNGFLSDVSEWRAINGVTKPMYEKVSPFLCAIPSDKLKVNVNTLEERDAPLLAALLKPYLTDETAKELISNRDPIDGWRDLDSFFSDSVFSEINRENKEKIQQNLDVKSRFFEADTEITLDDNRLRLRSLLKRDDEGQVTVIRRRFGGTSERNSDNTPEQ